MTASALPPAVFFDWDGTLVDTYALLQGVHETIMHEMNLPVPPDPRWFEAYFGKPRDFIFKGIYTEQESEGRSRFEKTYFAKHTEFLNAYDGAPPLLSQLKNLGVTLGVVSNKNPAFLNAEITHLGWGPYFSCIIGAGEADEDKPSAAPLRLAAERIGITAKLPEIWYVGDTQNDLLCAQSAGVKFIFMQTPFAECPGINENNTFGVFKNLTEMLEFLLQSAEKQVKE